jgi:hypothetical protein
VAGDRGLKASFARLVDADLAPRSAGTPAATRTIADDDECDVLVPAIFLANVTELLVDQVPSLTGAQITQVRRHMLEFARSHGWIDG